MPDTDTPSIREVLEEAVNQAPKPEAPPAQPPASTPVAPASSSPAPISDGKEEELEAVNPRLREQIKGELAELSPEKQAAILKSLSSYDRHFHKQLQGVSELRRFAEGLVQRFPGITLTELEEALASKRTAPTRSTAPASVATEEDIDALIEKASSPEVREELRKSKQVLHREMDKRLEERLKPLQDELAALKQQSASVRGHSIEQEIDALEEVDGFPASFIEKHRNTLRAYALKWNLPAKEVLPKLVPAEELYQAWDARTKSTAPPAPAVAPARSATAPPVSNGNLERFKETRGGWNVKGALRAMLPKS